MLTAGSSTCNSQLSTLPLSTKFCILFFYSPPATDYAPRLNNFVISLIIILINHAFLHEKYQSLANFYIKFTQMIVKVHSNNLWTCLRQVLLFIFHLTKRNERDERTSSENQKFRNLQFNHLWQLWGSELTQSTFKRMVSPSTTIPLSKE